MDSTNQDFLEPGNSDFNKYLKLVIRNWYWFVLSLLLAIGVAKIINVLTMRTYKISCELTVGEKENEVANVMPTQNQNFIDFNKANPINKEIGVLKSKSLAEQTLQSLDFDITYYEFTRGKIIKRRRYNDTPFEIIPGEKGHLNAEQEIYLTIQAPDRVLIYLDDDMNSQKEVSIGESYSYEDINFEVVYRDDFTEPISQAVGNEYLFFLNSFNNLLEEFWPKLQVAISPTSQNILKLSMIAENSDMAIAYLNKLCQLYDRNDLQLRNRMAMNTITYIDDQLTLLNQQLSQAEDKLIRFKQNNKIIQREMAPVIPNEILQLDKELQNQQYQLTTIQEIRSKLDSILNGGNILLPIIYGESLQYIADGLENINKLVLEREMLLKNQKQNSPSIVKIDQQLQVEIKAFRSYLGQSAQRLSKNIRDAKSNLSKKERELLGLPSVERELAKLTREFELTENIYNLYQQKRIEAKLAEASTVSNVRMLNPPSSASLEYITPDSSRNLKLAIILGLVIPLLGLILIEITTNRVRNVLDITQRIDLPVVGKINHSRSNIYLPTREYPWAAITESFRTLHARLKYMLPDENQNVVAITSASSGEGKTFCAMNLAAIMAAAGKKVLLIGLDLRRPKIHEVFEMDNSVGLTTYLIGTHSRKEIIHDTFQKNLSLINAGPVPPNPVELIEHKRMSQLLDECRKEFDYVVIDSPPVGLVADALLITKLVDLSLFVVRFDHTKKNIVELLRDLRDNNSLKQLSLVFNDIREQVRYGYGYGYSNNYYQKEEVRTLKHRLLTRLFRRT